MIQALIKKGMVVGEQVPMPVVSDGSLLIKVVNSCISVGTEMSGVKESGKSLIKKAMEQPDKIKKVLDMALSEGISRTISKVRDKLDSGAPTGYSISGVVIAVGKGVTGFEPGDHVAAAGAGIANHAEYVDVPVNLVMKMPDGLDFLSASTVTLGGIAMQGVRRAGLQFGEICVVVGCGVLGLLSVQMLSSAGIRVIATDVDDARLELALWCGAERAVNAVTGDPVAESLSISGGHGVDAVIFTAATHSCEPLSQSFKMCRKKGRVILVGVSGMEIKREDIYGKELDFLISTSYGPGRYDSNYEEKGLDYPYGYVRWTENRNMTEYLRLLKAGHVRLERLIQAEFPIEKVSDAFAALNDPIKKPLMVILGYGNFAKDKLTQYLTQERKIELSPIVTGADKRIKLALVGCGSFATGMHLPNLEKLRDKYEIYAVMNRTGHKAKAVGSQYKAHIATTEYSEILNDKAVDLVLIATRHDNHAEFSLRALQAGKHVFVEKPLAVTPAELCTIEDFYGSGNENKPLLFVGYNRRFSRYAVEIQKHTARRVNPLFMRYRMNAGYIPAEHWVHEHGGRIVGEGCHIIDLMTAFTGSKIVSVTTQQLSPANEKFSAADNKSFALKYADGSVAVIDYFAVGNSGLPKECLEVHFDGKSIVMTDYKSLKGYGLSVNEISSLQSEKGQAEELEELYNALKSGGKWPIELWDLLQTTRVTFAIAGLSESLG